MVGFAGGYSTRMQRVVMYCTRVCSYCARAERLLTEKGVVIEKVQVEDDPGEFTRMVELSGRYTVPQIFIGGVYVGGYDDLAALDRRGGLDPLLAQGD